MNLFLEIFLYFDVFIIGAVASTALRHAYAHFRPHEVAKPSHPNARPESQPLSKEVRDKLTQEAETKYQKLLENSVDHLSKELGITSDKINQVVDRLAADMLSREQSAYQQLLKDYQQQTEGKLDEAKTQTSNYQSELKTKMEEAAAAEQKRLIELIDNKLSDALMAFLLEAMGHEVDLGAQSDYLLKTLEQHKDELKQAIKL